MQNRPRRDVDSLPLPSLLSISSSSFVPRLLPSLFSRSYTLLLYAFSVDNVHLQMLTTSAPLLCSGSCRKKRWKRRCLLVNGGKGTYRAYTASSSWCRAAVCSRSISSFASHCACLILSRFFCCSSYRVKSSRATRELKGRMRKIAMRTGAS
jgi:hypothetical protein